MARGGHPTERNKRCVIIGLVMALKGNSPEKSTVKTAGILCLCCVFCNCMQYSAAWDVLVVRVMYKLRSIAKHVGSVSRSECLELVTAVTFVNIAVLGFGLCLCLSYRHTPFC